MWTNPITISSLYACLCCSAPSPHSQLTRRWPTAQLLSTSIGLFSTSLPSQSSTSPAPSQQMSPLSFSMAAPNSWEQTRWDWPAPRNWQTPWFSTPRWGSSNFKPWGKCCGWDCWPIHHCCRDSAWWRGDRAFGPSSLLPRPPNSSASPNCPFRLLCGKCSPCSALTPEISMRRWTTKRRTSCTIWSPPRTIRYPGRCGPG